MSTHSSKSRRVTQPKLGGPPRQRRRVAHRYESVRRLWCGAPTLSDRSKSTHKQKEWGTCRPTLLGSKLADPAVGFCPCSESLSCLDFVVIDRVGFEILDPDGVVIVAVGFPLASPRFLCRFVQCSRAGAELDHTASRRIG